MDRVNKKSTFFQSDFILKLSTWSPGLVFASTVLLVSCGGGAPLNEAEEADLDAIVAAGQEAEILSGTSAPIPEVGAALESSGVDQTGTDSVDFTGLTSLGAALGNPRPQTIERPNVTETVGPDESGTASQNPGSQANSTATAGNANTTLEGSNTHPVGEETVPDVQKIETTEPVSSGTGNGDPAVDGDKNTNTQEGGSTGNTPTASAISNYIVVGNNPGDASCIHFDGESVDYGDFSRDTWRGWIPSTRFSIGDEFLAVENSSEHGEVIRHKYVPSSRGTERVTAAATLPVQKTYRLAQSIFLEPGWDWGGEKSQGGKMGFGFGGGTSPTGGTIDYAGFTARMMWRGQGDGTAKIGIYSYAADRPKQYGEDILIENYLAPIGEWINLIIEIQTNSSTSSYDGRMRIWLDGEEVLDKQNVGWQLEGNEPSIDSLFYSSFYGGSDASWSPDHTTYQKLRDVCWSAVVDGYSGIDPDAGRFVVNSTYPDSLLSDVGVNTLIPSRSHASLARTDELAEEAKVRLEIEAPAYDSESEQYVRAAVSELRSARQLLNDMVTADSTGLVSHFLYAREMTSILGNSSDQETVDHTRLSTIDNLIIDATRSLVDTYIAKVEELEGFETCEKSPRGLGCEDLLSSYQLILDYSSEMDATNLTNYFTHAELASYHAINLLTNESEK